MTMKNKNQFIILTLSFLLFVTGVNSVFAQTFSFQTTATTKIDTPNSEVVFDIPIINTSNQTITVCVMRRNEILPAGWQGSMCFDESCFPPNIDSVATTPAFNSAPIAPGDTVDFSYHVFTGSNPGTGTFSIVAKETRNMNDSIRIDFTITTRLAGVNEELLNPSKIELKQNYPNPFNPSTQINFSISSRQLVNLKVYNIIGNEIATIVNEVKEPGSYSVDFNSKTKNINLPSGVYFYKLTAGNKVYVRKMILEK